MTIETSPEPQRSRPAGSRFSRKAFLAAGGAGLAGLAAFGTPPRAAAVAPALTVDLTSPAGPPTYAASGFLHGLGQDGTEPPDELLLPLKPRLFRGGGSTLPGGGWSRGGADGFAVRWRNVVDRYTRATSPEVGAEYCIVLSDLWGANGVDITPEDPYPGDGGDWSYYEEFIRQLMGDIAASGMAPEEIQLEIWNEPDYQVVYWPRPQSQYEEMWRRGVRLIRAIDPRYRIEGPTFTRMSIDPAEPGWKADAWLDMTVASDTVPDILSWHALGADHVPVSDTAVARRLLAERGLTGVALELNEYLPNTGLDAGYNTWYVAQIQRAGIDYTALAIYGACCMYPELDGLLVRRGEELLRTARWWVYQRYASITGELVAVEPTEDLDAVAGVDDTAGRARILVGNAAGDGSDLGAREITITGLAARRELANGKRIKVRVERIPDQSVLEAPEVLSEREYRVTGDRLTVPIDWSSANDAYVITLGRQDDRLPRLVIAGGRPDPAYLLPGHPTAIAFTLRNFTDRDISVTPRFDVSEGYRLEAPRRFTVPANGDAVLSVTVTRPDGVAEAGAVSVAALDQSSTVELLPSDNWVRIAELTASSTHFPSAVANLNDGRISSEDWGGGGAGGWNDDTPGAFPDVVTATWPSAVPLGRIRLHTLDSAGLPASAWGVRDVDVRARVSNAWQTVAQFRGNVRGVLEAGFAPVETDQLQVVILDSNDHTYSRLVEVEAYTA